MLIGYGAAAFSVAIFGYLALALAIIVSTAASGAADWSMLSQASLMFFWCGLAVIAFLALPVWLAGALYAERRAITSAGWYLKAGAAAAAAGVFLVSLFTFNPVYLSLSVNLPGLLGVALLGIGSGTLGGWVYWIIAGRHAGEWRKLPAEPVIQSGSTGP